MQGSPSTYLLAFSNLFVLGYNQLILHPELTKQNNSKFDVDVFEPKKSAVVGFFIIFKF